MYKSAHWCAYKLLVMLLVDFMPSPKSRFQKLPCAIYRSRGPQLRKL
jgi:hypothetical protein